MSEVKNPFERKHFIKDTYMRLRDPQYKEFLNTRMLISGEDAESAYEWIKGCFKDGAPPMMLFATGLNVGGKPHTRQGKGENLLIASASWQPIYVEKPEMKLGISLTVYQMPWKGETDVI